MISPDMPDLVAIDLEFGIIVCPPRPEVGAGWTKKRPPSPGFMPTSGSWLNLVEVFFLIITLQAVRRSGSFTSFTRH